MLHADSKEMNENWGTIFFKLLNHNKTGKNCETYRVII